MIIQNIILFYVCDWGLVTIELDSGLQDTCITKSSSSDDNELILQILSEAELLRQCSRKEQFSGITVAFFNDNEIKQHFRYDEILFFICGNDILYRFHNDYYNENCH